MKENEGMADRAPPKESGSYAAAKSKSAAGLLFGYTPVWHLSFTWKLQCCVTAVYAAI